MVHISIVYINNDLKRIDSIMILVTTESYITGKRRILKFDNFSKMFRVFKRIDKNVCNVWYSKEFYNSNISKVI